MMISASHLLPKRKSPNGWSDAVATSLLLLLAGFLITWWLWLNEQQNVLRVMQTRFDSRVKEFENLTGNRIHDYEQVLIGMRGLFAASHTVGREEFRDYVATLGLEKDYPGTYGVCYSLIVAPEQRGRHIAAVRKEGFPDYTIKPDGTRDFYTTAIYLEPFSGRNRQAFGFDNFTDSTRRSAMEKARDTGELTLSGKVQQLHGDNPNQASIRIYLPVYKKGASTLTIEDRRKNILGWLYMPILMDDLMRDALGARTGRLDVEIFDGENSKAHEYLLYDSDSSHSHLASEVKAMFKTVKTLNFHDHKWTLAAHSLPDFDARINEGKQSLIIYAGIGASQLLAILAGLLMYGRARILRGAQAVAKSEAQLASVIETALDAVVQLDNDGRVVNWNSQAEKVFGWPRQAILGQLMVEVAIPSPYRKIFHANMDKFRVAPENFTDSAQGIALSSRSELFALNRDGREFPIELSMTQNMLDDGGCLFTAFIRDISERKATEERMKRLAHHDTLTDLPNRTLFSDRLQQAMAKAKRNKGCLALMFIDLDKFKPINDTYGHGTGDLLLREVAARMQLCVRESDTVSRIGGDEFVILLSTIEGELDAMMVADKVLRAIGEPFELGGHSLSVSSSIGIAIYPEHGDNDLMLTKHADIAMYHAKHGGSNNARIFQADMQQSS